MGNRNKTTIIGSRIMRSLVGGDAYSSYDGITIPCLQDDAGFENPHGRIPENVQVVDANATLYGEMNVIVVPYLKIGRLTKRSEQVAESSTFDDGMIYNDILYRVIMIVRDLIKTGSWETLTDENYYEIAKNTKKTTKENRRERYDAALGRNRKRLLARVSEDIKSSIGTGNVWHRLFQDHVSQTTRLNCHTHKTADESMTWFAENLVANLIDSSNFAISLYTPGSLNYGKSGMKHDKKHTLAPPYLLASLDVILTASAVPGGVDSLAAFLPTRHCTKELIVEIVIVGKKITESYKTAYDKKRIPQLLPKTEADLKNANAKLKFIWRASFYQAVLNALSSSPDLSEKVVPTIHSESLRLSAFARAVSYAVTGEIPEGSADHEQTMLAVPGGGEMEAMAAIFGPMPRSVKEKIEKAARKAEREPSKEETQYWMVGSHNDTTHSRIGTFMLRVYGQFTKEQTKDPQKCLHFFAIDAVRNENEDFIRSNQRLQNHRTYSSTNVEHHGMISRNNQFDAVYEKMCRGSGSGTVPVITDVAWMRKNVSSEKKGQRKAPQKDDALEDGAAADNADEADDEGGEDSLEDFKGTIDGMILADREQYVGTVELLQETSKILLEIEEESDIEKAQEKARRMNELLTDRLEEVKSAEAQYGEERDELYSGMPSGKHLSRTIGVLDGDSDEDHDSGDDNEGNNAGTSDERKRKRRGEENETDTMMERKKRKD